MAGLLNRNTQTPTGTTGGGTGAEGSIDVIGLYTEWAAGNPHLNDPQSAFQAGVDIGLGFVDDFSAMPYDPSAQPDVLSGVDTFTEQVPIAGAHGGVDDFTAIFPTPGGNPQGFTSPGYQTGPEGGEKFVVDLAEFGIPTRPQRQDAPSGN